MLPSPRSQVPGFLQPPLLKPLSPAGDYPCRTMDAHQAPSLECHSHYRSYDCKHIHRSYSCNPAHNHGPNHSHCHLRTAATCTDTALTLILQSGHGHRSTDIHAQRHLWSFPLHGHEGMCTHAHTHVCTHTHNTHMPSHEYSHAVSSADTGADLYTGTDIKTFSFTHTHTHRISRLPTLACKDIISTPWADPPRHISQVHIHSLPFAGTDAPSNGGTPKCIDDTSRS